MIDIKSPNRIISRQSYEWRLLFFVRLAIELLTAGSQAADGAGFQLFASRSKKQFLSFVEKKIRAKLIKSTFSCRTRKARTAIAGSFYHFSAIFRPQTLSFVNERRPL